MDGNWIAVVDRSPRIASEHLAQLFERLYRVSTPGDGAPPGFGLGLSIV